VTLVLILIRAGSGQKWLRRSRPMVYYARWIWPLFTNISCTFGHFPCEIGTRLFGTNKHYRNPDRSRKRRSERGRHHAKGTRYVGELQIWPSGWTHELPFSQISPSSARSYFGRLYSLSGCDVTCKLCAVKHFLPDPVLESPTNKVFFYKTRVSSWRISTL